MNQNLFHIVANLDSEVAVPADGIKSKIVYQDEHVKAVLFGFAPGQGLSEHTTPMPGILYFVRGEAKVSLGDEQSDAAAGTWIHMQPNLPHSIFATSETVMLLLMLRCGRPATAKPAPARSDEATD